MVKVRYQTAAEAGFGGVSDRFLVEDAGGVAAVWGRTAPPVDATHVSCDARPVTAIVAAAGRRRRRHGRQRGKGDGVPARYEAELRGQIGADVLRGGPRRRPAARGSGPRRGRRMVGRRRPLWRQRLGRADRLHRRRQPQRPEGPRRTVRPEGQGPDVRRPPERRAARPRRVPRPEARLRPRQAPARGHRSPRSPRRANACSPRARARATKKRLLPTAWRPARPRATWRIRGSKRSGRPQRIRT